MTDAGKGFSPDDSVSKSPATPVRVGLVATDPMRIMGLQAIMRANTTGRLAGGEVIPLSVPGVLNDVDLRVVLIDASCTQHLMELVATFSRVRPHVRVIVIGDSKDQEYIQQVIGAGAKGYLPQTADETEIRLALEVVYDGSIWAPRKVLSRLLDASKLDQAAGTTSVSFTERELQVLRLLVTGLGNREIAEALNIDESTVKAHLGRLMRKVGAKNRIGLTVEALRHHPDLARSA
ncbi:response regulator transcription factor [Granulicella sibirica]|uniref:DNA-binding response regulator, LuxR family n=1 Tax=Granulicella sibirica TaxID=2479048 RepID=A0A4Q0T1F0_9BACT|nr:response regulator transcription factor [Granulicella sibirica]RXH56987.1 DNA-binding response regulator, LuxR family [Granulicella sibirica]